MQRANPASPASQPEKTIARRLKYPSRAHHRVAQLRYSKQIADFLDDMEMAPKVEVASQRRRRSD